MYISVMQSICKEQGMANPISVRKHSGLFFFQIYAEHFYSLPFCNDFSYGSCKHSNSNGFLIVQVSGFTHKLNKFRLFKYQITLLRLSFLFWLFYFYFNIKINIHCCQIILYVGQVRVCTVRTRVNNFIFFSNKLYRRHFSINMYVH